VTSRGKTTSEASKRQLARDLRALRLERKQAAKVTRRPAGSKLRRLSSPAMTSWASEASEGLLAYLEGEGES
jgi:hypothetical protein